MKLHKFEENKSCCYDENISCGQKDLRLENLSDPEYSEFKNSRYDVSCKGISSLGSDIENKVYIVGKDFDPPTLYADFTNLRCKSRRRNNSPCLSDELNNKDYLKNYEKETGFVKKRSNMHHKENKITNFKYESKKRKPNKLFNYMTISPVEETIHHGVLKHKIMKNLKIKYLKAFKEQIQPIIRTENHIRVYESYYPLSSSFLLLSQNNQTGGMIMGDQSEFKRVKQMIFDKKEQDYKYLLEEKFPQMANGAYFEKQFKYYCAWLDSQNNKQAHDLVKGIQNSCSKSLRVFLMLNSDRFRSNSSRFYIRQLSKTAQKKIKTMPYMRRKTVYNKNKSFPELIEMSINQKYIDVVNYTPTFRDGSEGLKWVQYFRTKHLLKFHMMKIDAKFKFSDSSIVDTPDFTFCMDCQKNEEGKTVSKRLDVWHQSWVEDGIFYSEYYSTFRIKKENLKVSCL